MSDGLDVEYDTQLASVNSCHEARESTPHTGRDRGHYQSPISAANSIMIEATYGLQAAGTYIPFGDSMHKTAPGSTKAILTQVLREHSSDMLCLIA
jgi:hypothetical protein